MRRGIAAALAAALFGGCASVPDVVTLPYVSHFSDSPPGGELPLGWEVWTLSRFKKPTQYQLVMQDGRTVVKASAHASASGLLHRLSVDPRKYPLLHWRWKVTELIATADNSKKNSEDSPVRVAVSFDGDIEKLPLGDRVLFDSLRLLSGQNMPYATLIYIWENRAPKDTIIPNPHTSRVKMIVVESGGDKLGNWQVETRNVYDDFKRAFGEEPGTITSVGIMTDTDNTGANVHAYYGDIQFRRVPPPRVFFATD
jgi:hypothetical protein